MFFLASSKYDSVGMCCRGSVGMCVAEAVCACVLQRQCGHVCCRGSVGMCAAEAVVLSDVPSVSCTDENAAVATHWSEGASAHY